MGRRAGFPGLPAAHSQPGATTEVAVRDYSKLATQWKHRDRTRNASQYAVFVKQMLAVDALNTESAWNTLITAKCDPVEVGQALCWFAETAPREGTVRAARVTTRDSELGRLVAQVRKALGSRRLIRLPGPRLSSSSYVESKWEQLRKPGEKPHDTARFVKMFGEIRLSNAAVSNAFTITEIVKRCTGREHYAEVSVLLHAAASVKGKTTPFSDPETLKRALRRYARRLMR